MNPLMNSGLSASMIPIVNPMGNSMSNSMMLNQSALMRSASLDNPMKNLKKSECSIIVRDLSFFCNENHLKELVTCYGLCTKIHICRSEESNHRSLLHAFVEMAHEETVYSLIEELHCVVFMGRQLKIQRCHENPEMKEFMNQKVEKMGIQVYVRFESMEDRGHGLVNEERLREVFADCGDIEDAIIQRHSQNLWRQKGYGFIFFLTFEGAELATKNKNGIMYDNVYYQCEYTHKAKEKINAIIATPEQFQFYQVGARGNGPAFPTSAFEVGAAANRLEHPAYASTANAVNVSQREHYSSGNYPYSSQDPAPRGPPVTRTTSFPTINNYSSAPSSDFIPRDRTNEANLPFSSATSVDDQSWNYPTQQPPVTSNSSFRVAAGGGVGAGSNNVSGSSYSSTSWTSNTVAATASQEFIRTSEHYNSESVSSPSYSQLSQQSSQTSYLNNHYSAAQPTPVTTTVPTNGPGYVESIGGGLRENSNNGLLGPSASSSDYGKYQILPPSSTSAVSAASSSTQYQYQQQQQAPRGNTATTAYPSFK